MAKRATTSQRSLTTVDPLSRYLQEVGKYPLLTAEEERKLAIAYREKGDKEAARKLVSSHLRLVVKIAMEYRQAYYNILDLIQEGSVGLLRSEEPTPGLPSQIQISC